MQRIMLATDFSERSDRALRRAVLLAKAEGAVLDLVHVVDDDQPRRIVEHEAEDARILLGELAQSLRTAEGLACAAEVVLGDPFAGIAGAVADKKPDLLVIGPHRRQILRDAFVGTTAERTIRSVDCPVLMVNGPPVGAWRHILLTTDLSENSRSALQRFAALGLGRLARRSVLYVFDAVALRLVMADSMPKDDREDYLSDQKTHAHRDLAQFLADLSGLKAELLVRHEGTTVVHEIQKAAEALNADLIVVSTQGRGAVERFFLGSVTEKILQSARVDVLALPPAPGRAAAP